MRKTSRTMLLVGMILAIVYIALFVLIAIGCFIFSGVAVSSGLIEFIAEKAGINDTEGLAIAVVASFVAMGVFFIIMGCFAIPTAVVAKKARDNPTKGLCIANIVFGLLCGTYFSVAGGVLGLIATSREERNARREKVVDAQ